MAPVTEVSRALRGALTADRREILDVLERYGARNPRLSGSVAGGDAESSSDVDLLVDLDPGRGNDLLRVAGIGEELGLILGTRVDVVTASLLRGPVSHTALADAVDL